MSFRLLNSTAESVRAQNLCFFCRACGSDATAPTWSVETWSGGQLLRGACSWFDSITIGCPSIHCGQELCCFQAVEGGLRNLQEFPDHGCGVLHLREPLGRRGPQAHSRKGRLHKVGGAQIDPMFTAKLIKRGQSLLVILEPRHRFGSQRMITSTDLVPQRLTGRLALRVGHRP